MQPSIRRCGFFCIRSRSLNVPGSDSSALQHRYLSISPLGMKLAFFPIEKPGAAAAAEAGLLELAQHRRGVHLEQRLAHRPVAAEPLVHGHRVEVGLVDVGEEHARLVHSSPSSGSGANSSQDPAARAGPGGAGAGPRRAAGPRRRCPARRRRPARTSAARLALRLGRRRGHRVARVLEPAPRHHGLARLELADHLGRVLDRQRPHVAPVERRHRRHVAGAEALELAQVHVLPRPAPPPPRRARRTRDARYARGRPRSCTRTRTLRAGRSVRSMS